METGLGHRGWQLAERGWDGINGLLEPGILRVISYLMGLLLLCMSIWQHGR